MQSKHYAQIYDAHRVKMYVAVLWNLRTSLANNDNFQPEQNLKSFLLSGEKNETVYKGKDQEASN